MSLLDRIIWVCIFFAAWYGTQYFYDRLLPDQTITSGSEFMAPKIEDINKPLQLEVEYQNQVDQPECITIVTTKLGEYTFSNKGAVLQAFSFPWQNGTQTIGTLQAESQCLFIALEHDTPLMYNLISLEHQSDGKHVIVYSATFQEGILTKRIVVHDDSYQVDMNVAVDFTSDVKNESMQFRIFLPQPVMQPVVSWDKVTGLINERAGLGRIDLTAKRSLESYWLMPTCFGYESRFLIHAFIQDEQHGIQRGYMMLQSSGIFTAILESKNIICSDSWDFKFFIGPKMAKAINAVDNRLLKTLNFGWLAPLAHGMLSILQFLYEQIGNYGWAIILLTCLLKLLMLPFTMYGEKNMRKGAEMQQKLAYIQKKYKDNPAMLEQARAELIRKHGLPGLTGCLPVLLTLPILISLNTVLSNAIELYGASFLWMHNLYSVDPYYILPIGTGLAMLATPMDNDPKKSMMRYAMALMMATVSCYFSAGLVLFILVNSLFAAIQAQLQKR